LGLLLEVGEHAADAQGDGVPVGVEEAGAHQAVGDLAEHFDDHAFFVLDVEAGLDGLLGHEEDFLHRQGHVAGLDLAMEAGLAGQGGIDPVGEDDHIGKHLAALAVAAHAHHLVAIHQQAFDGGLADHQRAGFLHLRREPLVELGADDGVAVVGGLVVVVGAEVGADEGFVVQYPHALLDDVALQGGVVPEVGDDLLEGVGVQDGALHVLRARVFTPFDLQHRQAGLGCGVGGGVPRGARADNDDVEFLAHGGSPVGAQAALRLRRAMCSRKVSVSTGSTCMALPTMP
jgi:hypothetical protein